MVDSEQCPDVAAVDSEPPGCLKTLHRQGTRSVPCLTSYPCSRPVEPHVLLFIERTTLKLVQIYVWLLLVRVNPAIGAAWYSKYSRTKGAKAQYRSYHRC